MLHTSYIMDLPLPPGHAYMGPAQGEAAARTPPQHNDLPNMYAMSVPAWGTHDGVRRSSMSSEDGRLGQEDRARRLGRTVSGGGVVRFKARPALETLREVSNPASHVISSAQLEQAKSAPLLQDAHPPTDSEHAQLTRNGGQGTHQDPVEYRWREEASSSARNLARNTQAQPSETSILPAFRRIFSSERHNGSTEPPQSGRPKQPKPLEIDDAPPGHYWRSKSSKRPPELALKHVPLAGEDLYSPSVHSAVALPDSEHDPFAASVAELMQEDELGW